MRLKPGLSLSEMMIGVFSHVAQVCRFSPEMKPESHPPPRCTHDSPAATRASRAVSPKEGLGRLVMRRVLQGSR